MLRLAFCRFRGKSMRVLLGRVIALLLLPLAAAQADEMTLTFVTAEPSTSPDAPAIFIPWTQRVMASTPGAVKIEVRDGTAIVNPINMYDEVVQVPMIWNWAGRIPVESVSWLFSGEAPLSAKCR